MADRPYAPTTAPLDGSDKSTRFGHLGVPGFTIKFLEVVSTINPNLTAISICFLNGVPNVIHNRILSFNENHGTEVLWCYLDSLLKVCNLCMFLGYRMFYYSFCTLLHFLCHFN